MIGDLDKLAELLDALRQERQRRADAMIELLLRQMERKRAAEAKPPRKFDA